MNRPAAERFTILIETNQLAWTRAANRWSDLIICRHGGIMQYDYAAC
jgi:hypothetical protein